MSTCGVSMMLQVGSIRLQMLCPSSSRRLWLQVDVVEQGEVAEAVVGEEASAAAVVAVAALVAGRPVAGGHGLTQSALVPSLTHKIAQMAACAG